MSEYLKQSYIVHALRLVSSQLFLLYPCMKIRWFHWRFPSWFEHDSRFLYCYIFICPFVTVGHYRAPQNSKLCKKKYCPYPRPLLRSAELQKKRGKKIKKKNKGKEERKKKKEFGNEKGKVFWQCQAVQKHTHKDPVLAQPSCSFKSCNIFCFCQRQENVKIASFQLRDKAREEDSQKCKEKKGQNVLLLN